MADMVAEIKNEAARAAEFYKEVGTLLAFGRNFTLTPGTFGMFTKMLKC
jgi:hypothetical protein